MFFISNEFICLLFFLVLLFLDGWLFINTKFTIKIYFPGTIFDPSEIVIRPPPATDTTEGLNGFVGKPGKSENASTTIDPGGTGANPPELRQHFVQWQFVDVLNDVLLLHWKICLKLCFVFTRTLKNFLKYKISLIFWEKGLS